MASDSEERLHSSDSELTLGGNHHAQQINHKKQEKSRKDSNDDDTDLDEKLKEYGLQKGEDGKIEWNTESEDYPMSWGLGSKVYNNAIIFWLEFFMTFISTAGTSAADSARLEYGMGQTLSYFAFVSVYLIGQTIGGIVCSPLSETFGRRTIYVLSAGVFCFFNLLTGVIHSPVTVYVGRFGAGFIAAVPATVAFGSFQDTHGWENRVWIVYFYTLSGNLGLALGPIYAAYIVSSISWRWIFHIAAIVSFISAIASLFMRESHASQLVEKRVAKIREDTGRSDLKTEISERKLTVKDFIMSSLILPLILLTTEPLVTFCAILCSIAYGLIYGSTESLTIVYESFGWRTQNTSLAFLALALGLVLDIIPRFYDQWLFNRFKREKRPLKAETKIRSFAVACPALAIGLWIFAWTVPPKVTPSLDGFWVLSLIGLVLIGFAANDFAYVLFGFMADVYGPYAASAVASLSLSRTLVAAAFPLFTTQMYQGLGSNIASSILAAVATLFALTPILFLMYTPMLKKISKYADSEEDEEEEGDEESGKGEKGDGKEGGGEEGKEGKGEKEME